MALNIPYKQGGVFHAESFVKNQIIASGQTGDLITIGTLGKITELTYMAATSTSQQGGISVDIDGSNVIPTGFLDDNVPVTATSFHIAQGYQNSGSIVGTIGVPVKIRGEFITIKKDAGNTTESITLSYVTGVVK